MKERTALVANADSREGRLALKALSDSHQKILAVASGPVLRDGLDGSKVAFLDSPCLSELDWGRIASALISLGGDLDTIIHCPVDGTGPAVAEERIRSAWLAAKRANALLPDGTGCLLVLVRESEGEDAVDRAAARDAIIIATRAAQLDAFRASKSVRSNRLILSDRSEDTSIVQTIAALLDDRSSFVSGADIRVGRPVGRSEGLRLDGKSIIVTGSTSGIGRATAVEIARRGGWVGVAGRKPDLGADTLAEIRRVGGDGQFIRLDVTDPVAWADAIHAVRAAAGSLDGLVNNAGEAVNAPISELQEETTRFLVDLNYGGTRLGMTAALDSLAESGGTIVNVASVAGMRAGYGGSAYGASKAAMISLSTSFAEHVAQPLGVRVNCIQPGLIWSESVVDSLGEKGAAEFRDRVEARTPLGRVGRPDEVARFISFLLCGAAAGISGQAIPVSGGLELLHP